MEKIIINAKLHLGKEGCTERKRTTVVINDDGDEVHVGVEATFRVFEIDDKGNLMFHQEQRGDVRTLQKDAPIGCLFDSLNELLDNIPEDIDRTNP